MNNYDVAVIGGGIHGVGVAQAMAAYGYSVVLFEQNELASGTSSRSSKLIHGGLRYLEHGQLGLVRECLRERQILLNVAPHLVQLKKFFIPVYPETRRRPATLKTGLALYGLLTGLKKSAKFRAVPTTEWNNLDGLKTEKLQAVLQYWDAQTDDKLLTRAVMQSAIDLGADLLMPAKFVEAKKAGDFWSINYQQNETVKTLQSRIVVNATGPWANRVLELFEPRPMPISIDLVQGTHLVLRGTIDQGIYYVEAPADGRAIFVMPWYGKILLGTTETHFNEYPSEVKPTNAEIDYLLNTIKYYFPRFATLEIEDVDDAFAGLRVLPAMSGSAFTRPRETILSVDNEQHPSLLTIYGGKLTAYRATAQKILQRLLPVLPNAKRRLDTADIPLR